MNNDMASVFDTSREPLVSATGEQEGPVPVTSTTNEVSGLNPGNGGSETDVSGRMVSKINLRKNIRLATWNVQTLHETGKLDNVIREMNSCSISLLDIAKVTWTGCKHFTAASGELVIYSGEDTHSAGVAVILSKQVKPNLLAYKAISERLMYVRIKANLLMYHCYKFMPQHWLLQKKKLTNFTCTSNRRSTHFLAKTLSL